MANRLSSKDISTLYEKISNWGRWGKEDERGALNFITDTKRAAAAKLVKTGHSVSLALPLATVAAPDNPTPVTHLMVETGFESHTVPVPWAGDYFAIAPHGMANTHAVLGSDSASDVMPSGDSEHPLPIHVGTLVLMGIHLIDNADFDALAEACAKAERYEFLFSMCPLILERGTASPVNPVAIL